MRPNLHMQDMIDLYCLLLEVDDDIIYNEIFNACYDNYSVAETARVVKEVVGQEFPEWEELPIVTQPSDDIRSYHISSEKIRRVLNFHPKRTIQDGSRDLLMAFKNGLLPGTPEDDVYNNVKLMKSIALK